MLWQAVGQSSDRGNYSRMYKYMYQPPKKKHKSKNRESKGSPSQNNLSLFSRPKRKERREEKKKKKEIEQIFQNILYRETAVESIFGPWLIPSFKPWFFFFSFRIFIGPGPEFWNQINCPSPKPRSDLLSLWPEKKKKLRVGRSFIAFFFCKRKKKPPQ